MLAVSADWQLYVLLAFTGLFVFCAVVQVFYHWFFFGRLLRFNLRREDPAYWPPVSVVICARNELANLQKLIPILLKQDYPQFEVIIIDDRSDDPMYDFMLEQKATHQKVKLVRINYTPDNMNPKKFALTMGIKSARFDNLLFTDADCFPQSDQWIRSMARHFVGREEIVLGYSPYLQTKGLLNILIRFDTFFTAVQYFSFALAGLPYMGVGRNLAYKRSLFMKLKGFYKHMPLNGGDDDLFVNRASSAGNITVCLDEDSFTQSIPKTTWYQWYKQKTRHLAVGRFYKSHHKLMLGFYAASNLIFYLIWPFLLLFQLTWPIAAGFGLLKMVNHAVVMNQLKKLLRERFSFWAFPFLDLLHSIFIFAFSIPARFSKRVTWM